MKTFSVDGTEANGTERSDPVEATRSLTPALDVVVVDGGRTEDERTNVAGSRATNGSIDRAGPDARNERVARPTPSVAKKRAVA
jgi:hypothetical protein